MHLVENPEKKFWVKDFFQNYSLFGILLFAFLIRFQGINFGLPYLYNPDEHDFVDPAIRILTRGDLNPHWFGHPGSITIYLLAILFSILTAVIFCYLFLSGNVGNFHEFTRQYTNHLDLYDGLLQSTVYFGGRLLMVIFAVITVYLTYLMAKKIFSNKPIALLGAFLLAIAPLHIENSRIIRTDITTTMLLMTSLWFLLKFCDHASESKYLILSSLFGGFAISAKYTSAIIVCPILIHCVLADLRKYQPLSRNYFFDFFTLKVDLSKALLFIFLGFFLSAPFVILDFNTVYNNLLKETRRVELGAERLPGINNHIWYLKNALQSGIGGIFFEIFAAIGLCFVLFRRSYKLNLFLVFPIIYFLAMGCGALRWHRWMIPVLPFEAILFGVGLYGCYDLLTRQKIMRGIKAFILVLFILAVYLASLPTISYDIRKAARLSALDTRTIAKSWAEENIPPGSTIAYEQNTPHFHINPKNKFNLIDQGWIRIVSEPLDYYRNKKVDYIVISGYFKKLYYNEPKKYFKEISVYEELKQKTKLIKVFSNKENEGPSIEIYKINE